MISQGLIIIFWQDAKLGTIANVIILVVSLIGFGTWSYYRKYQNDVKTSLQQKEYFKNSELTETDIQHLPEPVKKYLHYTGSIGKPKVNNFKIAGPMTTLQAMSAVWGNVRIRVFILYLSFSILGSIFFGLLFNLIN